MRFPLDEQIVGGYDYSVPTDYSPHHLGVDWKANFAPLYAPKDGVILKCFVGLQGGNTIWFKPNGEDIIIRWLHLSEFKVQPGAVKEGQLIAITGNTGHSMGAHLHEDCFKNSVSLKFEDTINPHLYYLPPSVTYKQKDKPALYVKVGYILVPFATTYENYLVDFSGAKVVELSADEFSKYKISTLKIVK